MTPLHIENVNITIHQAPASIPSVGAALLQAFMTGPEEEQSEASAAGTSVGRPAIGDYWSGQGGFYAGDMRGDDGTNYGLIVSGCGDTKDAGSAKWGPEGQHQLSEWDGLANTQTLGESHPAAKLAATHKADLHSDFYLPARRELQLACATVPHLFGTDSWYWSSTHYGQSTAWAVGFEYGSTLSYYRDLEFRVRPVRRFIY